MGKPDRRKRLQKSTRRSLKKVLVQKPKIFFGKIDFLAKISFFAKSAFEHLIIGKTDPRVKIIFKLCGVFCLVKNHNQAKYNACSI